ncbi:hypothetical protein OIY29_000820 [Salmonella enterica subsp. enterica serovar Kentucky]|nr:hypothetical protein [Salmonella enterica subsp. enterica serovar Kentucky]EJZ9264443.1 hypothetical protein [Salmonella enterica subsp. enterica serovar Kentucky]
MQRILLQLILVIISGFWCIALQCAEVRTDIEYNSQIISQFDSLGALTGDPTLDTIHTPLQQTFISFHRALSQVEAMGVVVFLKVQFPMDLNPPLSLIHQLLSSIQPLSITESLIVLLVKR